MRDWNEMNLALKLAPNENYFTEELVGILLTVFKLFISNWKRFDLYLPLLKPKKRAHFFNKRKSQSKFGLEVSSQWELLHWGIDRYLITEFKLFISNWKRFDLYLPLLKAKKKKKKRGSFFTSPPPNLWMKKISVQIWPWSYLPTRTTSLRNW